MKIKSMKIKQFWNYEKEYSNDLSTSQVSY